MAQDNEVMKKVQAQVAALVKQSTERAARALSERAMLRLRQARENIAAARVCREAAR